MWKLKSMLAVLVTSAMVMACMTGCESGGDDKNSDPLVGTWTLTTANGTAVPSNFKLNVTFNSDGSGSANQDGSVESFTWSKTDTKLTITDSTGTDVASYSISGNSLTLNDSGDVLVFQK